MGNGRSTFNSAQIVAVTLRCVTCYVKCVTASSWPAMYAGNWLKSKLHVLGECSEKYRACAVKRFLVWFECVTLTTLPNLDQRSDKEPPGNAKDKVVCVCLRDLRSASCLWSTDVKGGLIATWSVAFLLWTSHFYCGLYYWWVGKVYLFEVWRISRATDRNWGCIEYLELGKVNKVVVGWELLYRLRA